MEGKHEYKQLEQLKLERTDSSTPAPPNTPVSQGSGTNGPTLITPDEMEQFMASRHRGAFFSKGSSMTFCSGYAKDALNNSQAFSDSSWSDSFSDDEAKERPLKL